MIVFATLLCTIFVPFAHSLKLHEQMTDDEIWEIFQTTRDSVPEYEVVSVQHEDQKRSWTTILRAKIFNEMKTLYLKPIEGLLIGEHTKVWRATRTLNKLNYKLIPNAMEGIGKLYQDAENKIAISIKTDASGRREFSGIIGRNFGIKPLPTRRRFRRDVSNNTDSYYSALEDHIVFKIPNPVYNNTFASANHPNEAVDSKLISSRSKRSAPDVVYPEILTFVDQKLFLYFDRDVTKTVAYMASFFNGVDLRYRAIQHPRVRINVAGIVLVDGFSPFFKSYLREDHFAVDDSLDDFAKYMLKQKQFTFKKDYDIALYITGIDLELKTTQGTYEKDVAGIAYYKGACKSDPFGIRSVGLIEDDGSFRGVITAAHELAHVMGVPHDDLEDLPDQCKWDMGYIMSYSGRDEKAMRFSPCSQEILRDFISSDERQCLHNPPANDRPIQRILPGKYMSLDEQCMAISQTNSCNVGEKVCVTLYCQHPDIISKRGLCVSRFPAAEGSRCGQSKICLNGECVYESDTVVPGVLSYY